MAFTITQTLNAWEVKGPLMFRASNGYVYYYTGSSTELRIYKSDATTPTSFTEQDSANRPDVTSGSTRVKESEYCGILTTGDRIQIYYIISNSGNAWVQYSEFDCSTDTWTVENTLISQIGAAETSHHIAAAVDDNDVPHLVVSGSDGTSTNSYIKYNNKIGGSWNASWLTVTSQNYNDIYGTSVYIDENNHVCIGYTYSLQETVLNYGSAYAFTSSNDPSSFSINFKQNPTNVRRSIEVFRLSGKRYVLTAMSGLGMTVFVPDNNTESVIYGTANLPTTYWVPYYVIGNHLFVFGTDDSISPVILAYHLYDTDGNGSLDFSEDILAQTLGVSRGLVCFQRPNYGFRGGTSGALTEGTQDFDIIPLIYQDGGVYYYDSINTVNFDNTTEQNTLSYNVDLLEVQLPNANGLANTINYNLTLYKANSVDASVTPNTLNLEIETHTPLVIIKSSGTQATEFYPEADIISANWTPSTGSDLWAVLDDQLNTDYAETSTEDANLEVRFAGANDPLSNTNHIVYWSWWALGGGGPERGAAWLYQGTTLIATMQSSYTLDRDTPEAMSYTLTSTEADAITNYADLRIRFNPNTLGNNEDMRVGYAYMSIPVNATAIKITLPTLDLSVDLLSPTVSITGGNTNVTTTQNLLNVTISQLSPTISGDAQDTQNTQDLQISLLSASVVISTSVTTTQNLLDLPVSLLSATATGVQNVNTVQNLLDLPIILLTATATGVQNVTTTQNLIDLSISLLNATGSATQSVTTTQNIQDVQVALLSVSVFRGVTYTENVIDVSIALLAASVLTDQAATGIANLQDLSVALLPVTANTATNISVDQNTIDVSVATLSTSVDYGSSLGQNVQDLQISQGSASGNASNTIDINTIDVSIQLLTATAQGTTNVSVGQNVIDVSIGLQVANVLIGKSVDQNVFDVSIALLSVSVVGHSLQDVTTRLFSIDLYSVTTGNSLTVPANAIGINVSPQSVSVDYGVSVSLNTIDVSIALLSVSVNYGSTIDQNTIDLPIALLSATTGNSVSIGANIQNVSIALLSATVDASTNISVSQNVIDVPIVLLSPNAITSTNISVDQNVIDLFVQTYSVGTENQIFANANVQDVSIALLSSQVLNDFVSVQNVQDISIALLPVSVNYGNQYDTNLQDVSIALFSASANTDFETTANVQNISIDIVPSTANSNSNTVVSVNTIDILVSVVNVILFPQGEGVVLFQNLLDVNVEINSVIVVIEEETPTAIVVRSFRQDGSNDLLTIVGWQRMYTFDRTSGQRFTSHQVQAQPLNGYLYRPFESIDVFKHYINQDLEGRNSALFPHFDSVDNLPGSAYDDTFILDESGNSLYSDIIFRLPKIENRKGTDYFFGFRSMNALTRSQFADINVHIGLMYQYNTIWTAPFPDWIAERSVSIQYSSLYNWITYEFQLTQQEIDLIHSKGSDEIYVYFRFSFEYKLQSATDDGRVQFFTSSIYLRQSEQILVVPTETIDIPITTQQIEFGFAAIAQANTIDVSIQTYDVDRYVVVEPQTIDTNITLHSAVPSGGAFTNQNLAVITTEIESATATGTAKALSNNINVGIFLKEPYWFEPIHEDEVICRDSIIKTVIKEDSKIRETLNEDSIIKTVLKENSKIR